MAHDPSQPVQPFLVPAGPGGTVTATPLRTILVSLFLEPTILFSLQYESWWRALRILVMMALCSGLVVGALRAPSLFSAVMDWSSWLGRELGGIRLEQERLVWDKPQELPYVTRHRGWRLDFVTANTPLPPSRQLGPERLGAWITPERVLGWQKTLDGDKLVTTVLVDKGKLGGGVQLDPFFKLFWPAGFVLRDAEFSEAARPLLSRFLVPAFVIMHGFNAVAYALLYTVLFSIIPVLLRSPSASGGWRQTFCFYAFASIPPLLAATVYASLNLPFLDYVTAFILCMFAYLILVARAYRRLTDKPDGRDDLPL